MWRFAGASHLRLTSQEPSELVRCLLSLRGRCAGCLKLPVGNLILKTWGILCDCPGEGIVTCFVEVHRWIPGVWDGEDDPMRRHHVPPSPQLVSAPCSARPQEGPQPMSIASRLCWYLPVPTCPMRPVSRGPACVSHSCPPLSRPPLPSPHMSLPSGLP